MAKIYPFCALHPASAYVSRVAALPYDVYSREEAAAEAARDPLSFLNIDRPETQFPPDQDMYAPEVYEKADTLLRAEIADGVFEEDSSPQYYLYELTMDGRSQTGLVACASIDDYLSGVIKKHENTRPEKEEDRVRHIDVTSMQTGPIFLAYHRDERIAAVVSRAKDTPPLFDFTADDGIRHRGWRISDPDDIRKIRLAFADIDSIYIADGHHRAASAVRVGVMRRQAHGAYDGSEEFNRFLCVLFPDDELSILDYNRVVADLNGLTVAAFLEKAAEVFAIEPCGALLKPAEKGSITMCLNRDGRDEWYLMREKDALKSADPVGGLDVSYLQERLLFPVLAIEDPKTDPRIDFVGGIRGTEELRRRVLEGAAAAFAMYPTSIQELFAVADAGRLMPPKSTWFEPKLRSGLFLHRIER